MLTRDGPPAYSCSCLNLFTLRFTLTPLPGVGALFKFLPEPLKKFVASQSLGPSQLKQLEECGYKVPTETSSTEMSKAEA